eukprot:3965701-Amphidinium_carterae.1
MKEREDETLLLIPWTNASQSDQIHSNPAQSDFEECSTQTQPIQNKCTFTINFSELSFLVGLVNFVGGFPCHMQDAMNARCP